MSQLRPKVPGKKKVSAAKRHTELLRAYMVKLAKSGGGTLTLAPGTYRMSNVVYVPSNVTIRFSAGTKLVKTAGSKAMFHLIRPSRAAKAGAVGGYKGEANITFAGAGAGQTVFDLAGRHGAMGIVMGHNRNVTVTGISFRNMYNGHFIEMDASANVVVSGNEFRTAKAGTKASKEAINLDTPDKLTKGFSAKWSKFDATPNNGVLIEGNTFSGLTRAVGTHNFSKDRYHQSVTIRNNTFTNHRSDPIRPLYWKDTVITGNVIDGVAPGNTEVFGIRAGGAVNPTITGNTFDNMWAPIVFYHYRNPNKVEFKVQGTAYNRLNQANLDALTANTAGPGLRQPAIQMDSNAAPGTVAAAEAGWAPIRIWLAGHAPVRPATPTGVGVTRTGPTTVAVTWASDAGAGNATPTHYAVSVYSDPAGTQLVRLSSDGSRPNPSVVWRGHPDWTGVGKTVSIPTGEYWIRVHAENAAGSGPQTAPIPVPA